MEQIISFVYDTKFCQTEADDPQKAVLFFHPNWVSDQQRLALCGQLMGAAHFCLTVFTSPRVLTLQCGKFVLKKFGRYILSVGSSQTLPEWILQERFNILELIIQFHHNSFDSIYNQVECDQESFSKKLTEILEIYVPILQYKILGNAFVVRCPKKNSAVFLEAFQLLEACCNFKGVLGGVILHKSWVIATQLDPDVTKLLALIDRFHIRTYAEQVKTPFHLPVGVQLLRVYLKEKIYKTLQNTVNIKASTFNGVQTKNLHKTAKIIKKKREINKIFTVHEEEDLNINSECVPKLPEANSKDTIRNKNRKLKLKIESNSLKERSKSFVSSNNIKVCSTPTVEKTLIHEELVSICSSGKIDQATKHIPERANFIPDVVHDAIKQKNRNRIVPLTKYFSNRLYRISMDDLMIDLTHKAYPVPLRYYSFGLPKICREMEMSLKEEKNGRKSHRKNFYKTIADPMNPVFRYDGIPVSKSLYNNFLHEHYKDFVTANITIDSREEFLKSKYLENKNFKPKTNLNLNSIDNNLGKNVNLTDSKASDTENSVKISKNLETNKEHKELSSANQKAFRRSLSLPLKPLFCDATENSSQNSIVKNKVLHTRTPTTPLTTKLSLLAFEEKQTEMKQLPTPSENTLPKKKSFSNEEKINKNEDNSNNETVTSSLFVCSYEDMRILLLLDKEVENNPDLILTLWEMSSTILKKVENLRNKSVTTLPNTGNNNSSYSFLSTDNQWGTVQRSGPWSDDELKIVGSLHQDLLKFPKITEIIIRNEESVVYGYSCGGTKIFYQQEGCSSAGLPTPADLMGVVTLKARRRLERDRDIVLL